MTKKAFLAFFGDIIVLYLALFATLFLRYGGNFYAEFLENHFLPFTIVFAFWLTVFYVAGLYDLRHLRNNIDFLKILASAIFVSAVLSVVFFYAIPAFGITPKTNLLVFVGIFTAIEALWRRWFNKIAVSGEAPNKIILVGGSEILRPIEEIEVLAPGWLKQLGYEMVGRIEESEALSNPAKISALRKSGGANAVVVPRHLKSNASFARELYKLLSTGTEIYDLPRLYEIITRKIPITALEETWFLENLAERQRFYDPLKRAAEFLAALIGIIILLPLEAFIAALIKLTSRGPVVYKQTRIGQGGDEFVLYKFRTMPVDAEKDGARWSAPDDARPTKLGRLLRKTHLDELPQFINIIKGDLSFVGPRPERPEFVKELKEKISYYEVRLLVKPGVTGWAQIHHRADASFEDVMEKLQYDIYYIKNRSLVLDLAIILKTIKTVFVSPK